MACTNKDLYKSVRKCPGTIIRPGIKPKFLAIPLSQILAWPKLPDPGDTTKGLLYLVIHHIIFLLLLMNLLLVALFLSMCLYLKLQHKYL